MKSIVSRLRTQESRPQAGLLLCLVYFRKAGVSLGAEQISPYVLKLSGDQMLEESQ